MSLSPGTRIGAYEIVAPLGEGGMGEVYRARDAKLGRDVAIKILPDHFIKDAERLARFEREARALASLNHPDIAQIYGFEDNALVMELVAPDAERRVVSCSTNGTAYQIDVALPRGYAVASKP
jgi:serine/threonine protein kinase